MFCVLLYPFFFVYLCILNAPFLGCFSQHTSSTHTDLSLSLFSFPFTLASLLKSLLLQWTSYSQKTFFICHSVPPSLPLLIHTYTRTCTHTHTHTHTHTLCLSHNTHTLSLSGYPLCLWKRRSDCSGPQNHRKTLHCGGLAWFYHKECIQWPSWGWKGACCVCM